MSPKLAHWYTGDGNLRGYGWFHNRSRNFFLGASPKCGTSSIKQFIKMHQMVDSFVHLKWWQVGAPVYFVVRHPLDRFCSLWRSKCRDARFSRHHDVIAGITPTELMNFIDTGVKDVHWATQTFLLDTDNTRNAKLIPLEMFGFWWKQSGLGELGKYHATEGDVDIDDDLKARILTHYAEDVELYHKAQCDFSMATIHA